MGDAVVRHEPLRERACCGDQGCTASPEHPCFCPCHREVSTVPCRRCGAPEGHARHLFRFCAYDPHDPRCIKLTGALDVREHCDCRIWAMLDTHEREQQAK